MALFCLPDILQRSAERAPEKLAIICDNNRVSYGELNTKASQMAAMLRHLGVRTGEPVLISIANSVEFVVALFGIAKAGGLVVPVNPDLSSREFEYIVRHCEARVLITTAENRKLLQDILPALTVPYAIVVLHEGPQYVREALAKEPSLRLRLCFPQEITGEEQGLEAPRLIDIDEAMIIYTSGTAGLPKGVVLTHLNLMTSMRSVVEYLRLSADDTGLICLPLFHIYTLSQLLTHLLCGGTAVLVENFLFPTQVLRFIERERVTGFGASPGAFQLLLNVKSLASYQLASLRYLLNSGGPLPQQTLLELMEAFPQAEIISAYGLTEASSRVSHCTYKKGSRRRLGSVGRPISNVDVRVVDAKGADVRPGELGEIVIRGSTVMKGYFKDADATARVLKSDGLHTGDFAILDQERHMFIVGRRDDIVNSGGESISAKEVEEVLLSHQAIAEAAVVGKPDEVLGEALQAFIVLRPELTVAVDAVKEHCLTHLARYKVPRDFVICHTLPKTPSGKVQKRLLREHLVEEASKKFA
jgi:long-chain acyl-CoA synthetase